MVYTSACPEKISRQADSGSIIKFISDHKKALKGENEKENPLMKFVSINRCIIRAQKSLNIAKYMEI